MSETRRPIENQEDDPLTDFSPEQREVWNEVKSKLIYRPDFVAPETYRLIFNHLDLKGKTFVDVGAGFVPAGAPGASEYFLELDGRGATVVPVEPAELPAKSWTLLPRKRDDETDTIAYPVRADAFQLPLADSSVDGGISVNFINALSKQSSVKEFLSEASRVTKPDGVFIISSFGYYRKTYADGSVKYDKDYEAGTPATVEFVSDTAQQAGFKHVEAIPISQERIQDHIRFALETNQKLEPNLVKIEIVESFGLMLIK